MFDSLGKNGWSFDSLYTFQHVTLVCLCGVKRCGDMAMGDLCCLKSNRWKTNQDLHKLGGGVILRAQLKKKGIRKAHGSINKKLLFYSLVFMKQMMIMRFFCPFLFFEWFLDNRRRGAEKKRNLSPWNWNLIKLFCPISREAEMFVLLKPAQKKENLGNEKDRLIEPGDET